ncbi:MAG: HutP family protein [Oscillospiraceae bacterium]|jgi:hypothetical protein|nr:HutP family protein [Oscillospiraceae bacterium]
MAEQSTSREVAAAAVAMSITPNRDRERLLRAEYAREGMKTAAVDFGGEFISSIGKIIEHTIVAARREGLISDAHPEEGAVAGAAREALSQIMPKAIGLNVGGKIAIARRGDHIGVAMYFGIGLLHLNEVCVGLGHRAV